MRKGLLSPLASSAKDANFSVPGYVKFAAILFRSIFLIILLIVTAWVSHPDLGSNWLDHFTLSDAIRAGLGALACLWMLVNLFILPKDAHGYRTWTYLGLALLPLAAICVIVYWR